MKSKREKYLECTKKSKNPSFHTLGEQFFQSKGKKKSLSDKQKSLPSTDAKPRELNDVPEAKGK